MSPRRLHLDLAEVLRLYDELGSTYGVASQLGCSQGGVYRLMLRHGFKFTRRHPRKKPAWNKSKLNAEDVIREYQRARSVPKTAKAFGTSNVPIRRILSEHGIKCLGRGMRKGHVPWNKGKKVPGCGGFTKRGKDAPGWKGGKRKLQCCICGHFVYRYPYQVTDHSVCSKVCNAERQSRQNSGSLSGRWKGGISGLNKRIRQLHMYIIWRKHVWERDGHRCCRCGAMSRLEAHHLDPVAAILRRNNITTMRQAKDCTELWDVSKGQTLCKRCHDAVYERGVA